MSTVLIKGKLKAAREAIQAKDYAKAEQAASDVIDFDSANYNARVFLAVAKLNLDKPDEAEHEYRRAIELQPSTLLAWQGLASFYEKRSQWKEYLATQRKLADLAQEAGDEIKCAEALQKILNANRTHGSETETLETLRLFLPDSPYYDTLSKLPPPDLTAPEANPATFEAQSLVHDSLPILEKILNVKEAQERERIESETSRRRQRLTTTTSAEETKQIVTKEVMGTSELPALYEEIMAHHKATDSLRRETEHKLLVYLHTYLLSLPSPFSDANASAMSESAAAERQNLARLSGGEKDRIRAKLQALASGMVTLRIPDPLAWQITFEWPDKRVEDEWDIYLCKRHIEIFPESGLSKLAQIQLGIPAPDEDEDEPGPKSSSEELVTLVEAAFQAVQATSIKAHILAADFFLSKGEYQLATEVADAGLSYLKRLEAEIGQRKPGMEVALKRTLGIALVHFELPKHHLKALRLLDNLLQSRPDDHRILLAKAYALSCAHNYPQAGELFARVVEETDQAELRFEAKVEMLWCQGNLPGRARDVIEELHEVTSAVDKDNDVPRTHKAKLWWRYGHCLMLTEDTKFREPAAQAFTTSIKRDNAFAPSFTALGFYYRDCLDPPDYEYALQCFQKAFELDDKEDVAAEILAHEYALENEWSLVESVARRVVQIDRFGASKTNAMPAPGTRRDQRHVWAWKAIGAADLKAKKYQQAVVSFHCATRGNPTDVTTWTQLALAYRGAGKHVAALKTLAKARALDPDDWHVLYYIGDIQRQLGLYEAALDTFEALAGYSADESVVRAALGETLLLQATAESRAGFTQRSASTACDACIISLDLTRRPIGPKVGWKLLGDALLHLSKHATGVATQDENRSVVRDALDQIVKQDIEDKLPFLQSVRAGNLLENLGDIPFESVCAATSVLCYAVRLLVEVQDQDAAGPAWFDLGYSLFHLGAFVDGLPSPPSRPDVTLESIQCLRSALQREPLNGTFWNLLGLISRQGTPKLAQHAFIRACELNLRSAVPWTNLGLFYLDQEDNELANKAFLKAQVLDPDYPQAWLGQAALARAHGDLAQAHTLVNHAANLAHGTLPLADISTASQTFEALSSVADTDFLITPHTQIKRYLATIRNSSTAHQLHGLLSERLEQFDEASSSFEKAASLLEAQYEIDESAVTEQRYATANASLGRANLARGRYEDAIANLDSASGLLETAQQESDTTVCNDNKILMVQCLLLKALAVFFSGQAEQSLEVFEVIQAHLEEHINAAASARWSTLQSQVTLLLSKVLFALGGDEQRSEAEKQLLQNIYLPGSEEPDVAVVTALSAMAIFQENEELLQAALAEIQKMPVDKQVEQDPAGDLAYLMSAHEDLRRDHDAAVGVYARALHATPTSADAQQGLATLAAQVKVDVAHSSVEMASLLRDAGISSSSALARVHQRPWKREAWLGLGGDSA